jgi:hypothetical protein
MGPGSVLRHRHSTSEGVTKAAPKPFFAGTEQKKPQISAVSEGGAGTFPEVWENAQCFRRGAPIFALSLWRSSLKPR